MTPDEPDLDRTRSARIERARGSAARALLHVVHPPELVARFVLDGPRTEIGRGKGAGRIVLDHPTLSRRHCVLERAPMAVTIADLGSRNGTRIDGHAVGDRPRPLTAPSAVLRAGDVVLVYERIDGVAAQGGSEVSVDAVPGRSHATEVLRERIARAARDPAPVLLLGETGTGKEWIARELHRLGGRPGPLVCLNSAALAPDLVESQLFGHLRGSFTGAVGHSAGAFREAEGGTLFLDEIGDLEAALQPKLLRAVQEREVQPVGTARAVRVDVRVVAATNRDLASEVEAGLFRRDLYARLALWEIRVPPLRARRADVLGWLDRLGRSWAASRGVERPSIALSAAAAEAIVGNEWPENLRGLDRLLHELASQGGGAVGESDLPAWMRSEPATQSGSVVKPGVPTREELLAVLRGADGSGRAAARHFSRDRRQIYRWIRSYGLEKEARGPRE